ncbi:MAG TPA: NAD(P)-dependent oxidoreductase [Burkholderiales bacterium]|nr:NAD(P)-dependent oxidoreductase [Burkholderiales bacterium]
MADTIMTGAPVGFIGLGIMGAAMTRNLLKAGFKLHVHNRSRAKVDALVRDGATDGASPAGVARASDVVLLCVPDTPDVERVLFAEDGVVHGIRPGAVVIDCSTVSPTATVDFARRLQECGAHMLDSPVSGGPKGAEDGTLSCMIGGEAAIVERCMPLFRAIGKTFTHVGGNGAGQACKACNQLVIVGTMMAISEAFSLAKKMAIDPYKVRDALLGGSAQSFVLQNHGKRLLDGTLNPGFRSSLMLKDIKLALGAGRDTGAFMPVTALGAQMFAALGNSGRDGLDNAALGLLFEELSGIRR